ncbi:reverse transcriptase domain-containing protein [Tanacetum coccineum]
MGYLARAYYSISPTRYYKDDSWWSADLKSKAIDDIISIGSFMEAHVLNHYVLVRKILADVPEVTLPPWKRLCISPGPRYEIGESSSATTTRPTGGFRQIMDTDEIYVRLDDAQSDRSLMTGHLNLLRRDRPSNARTAKLMESEARAAHEAWVQSMDSSDTTRSKKMAPKKRTTISSPARTTTTTTPMTDAELKTLIAQGVADVLAERDATRGRNEEDNHDSGMGVRRQAPLARDNCTMENQIKFATCTLLRSALTWWNSHIRTVGHDVAYAMTWTNLKKMMTNKYCLRGKIKKLEVEMWNFKVKGTDVVGYNQRFQELALMCVRMFPEESDKIEKYIGGLPDKIHGSVMASKPKTM